MGGATYKEINDNLVIAVKHNSNLKLVVRGLDYSHILDPANTMNYSGDNYPKYLYNDFILDDIKYILNKAVIKESMDVIKYTRNGGRTTTFDEYSYWNDWYTFGKKAIDSTYKREEKTNRKVPFSDTDKQNIYENITQNVASIAEDNPNIEFYLFFTPYNVYYWDIWSQTGNIERQLEAEKYVIELLLDYDNIHLFSFNDVFELTSNFDFYKDKAHYSAKINSQILKWIYDGEHELTVDNYKEYINREKKFYMSYDYDSLFIQE